MGLYSSCWKRWKVSVWCSVKILIATCLLLNVAIDNAAGENIPAVKAKNPSVDVTKSAAEAAVVAFKGKAEATATSDDQVKVVDQVVVFVPRKVKKESDGKSGGRVDEDESIGYAAEWEYEGPPLHLDEAPPSSSSTSPPASPSSLNINTRATSKSSSSGGNTNVFPSRRIGAGTWHDDSGSWWLFGGQQQQSGGGGSSKGSKHVSQQPQHYFSDLWRYTSSNNNSRSGGDASQWNLIFRPETGTRQQQSASINNPFTSAFPENLSFPLLCGSKNSRRLAVHGVVGGGGGGGGITTSKTESSSSSTESSPFSEDNVVWLYEFHGSFGESNNNNASRREAPSIWTSYVCCDACLPDGNATTNFEFCPQFTKETLSWCDHSGIMMLQPGSAVTSMPFKRNEYTTAKTTFAGASGVATSVEHFEDALLNWWKFDVDTTEWIKLPPVTTVTIGQGPLIQKLLQSGNCRVVSTSSVASDELVYILCPLSGSAAGQSILERTLILFDPARGTASVLGRIHLNNAFADKKVWQPGRSTLHAVTVPDKNMTIIFLAYHKLLDLWIHDHLKGKLYSLENVWKGDSLQVFQNLDQFYHLSVKIEGSNSVTSFFMVNPRNKLADFTQKSMDNDDKDDHLNDVHFTITIVPDKEVFLPQRDAEALDIPEVHKPIPQETLKMPQPKSKVQKSSQLPESTTITSETTTSPSSITSTTTAEFSNELLQKMEAHRRNKYRNDARSTKHGQQKRIPGIKRTFPINPARSSTTTPTTSTDPTSKITPSSSTTTNTTTPKSSSSSTASVAASSSRFPPARKSVVSTAANNSTSTSSSVPSSTTLASSSTSNISSSTTTSIYTSAPPQVISLTTGQISQKKVHRFNGLNSAANNKTGTNITVGSRANISSTTATSVPPPVLEERVIAPLLMKMMKAGGGGGVGRDSVNLKTLMMKRNKPEATTSFTTTPPTENISEPSKTNKQDSEVSSNFSPPRQIDEQVAAESIPLPQKLYKSSEPPPPPQLPVEQEEEEEKEDDDDDVKEVTTTISVISSQNNIASISTSRSIGGQQNNVMEIVEEEEGQGPVVTPEAEGDISDDHHIRSPGSMIAGGNAAGVEPRDANTMAMEHYHPHHSGGGAGGDSSTVAVDPTIFFAVSLSFFASFGVVLFVRRCVKCPPPTSTVDGGGLGGEDDASVLGGKEGSLLPHAIRYSVIPDDVTFHTPLV